MEGACEDENDNKALPTKQKIMYYELFIARLHTTAQLEAHLALREDTSCAKSKLCNQYLEWQLWFSLNALHTHFVLLTSKFFLKIIHTAYFGVRVYRDMCH